MTKQSRGKTFVVFEPNLIFFIHICCLHFNLEIQTVLFGVANASLDMVWVGLEVLPNYLLSTV